MKDYRQYKPLIPSFGAKTDSDIQKYLQSLDDWLRGTLEWCFQCRRYCGDDNVKVRESQIVRITPRAP